MSTSTISVQPQPKGLINYIKKIVRIQQVVLESGEVIFNRGLLSPYKKIMVLDAPAKYRVTLLCERPIKLSMKHPVIELEVDGTCDYILDCKEVDGLITATATPVCK